MNEFDTTDGYVFQVTLAEKKIKCPVHGEISNYNTITFTWDMYTKQATFCIDCVVNLLKKHIPEISKESK